jgi:uncharacterized protein YaaR (DUF327 family)
MPAEEKRPAEKPALEFKRQLTDLKQSDYEAYIRDLTQKINAQGETVARKCDIKELQKYREMITELLNETVSNSYAFSKTSQFDSKGRHKVYAVIHKVNSKLDELTEEVLKEQSDNIKVLGIIDDVRGLLVDLFL